MSVNLNKISLKQMGGEGQPQVDPQVMEISQTISASVQDGQSPQDVVAMLLQNQVDQQVIAQALMMVGMVEEDIMTLFEQIERSTQPSKPEEVNANPELLARNESIAEQEEQAAQQDPMMGMAESGIEIKPENKGKFTAWAKKRGMTVKEAYRKVLANKDKYPPSIVKMANFARNASKWKKAQEGIELKGKFVNGVYIPDEDEVTTAALTSEDALKANLARKDNYYMRDPQLAVMPVMPPKTVNPLFDIISTVGTVYNDIKGETSDWKESMAAYKAALPGYFNYNVDSSNVYSAENQAKIKDWAAAQKQEWEYQTAESKARADKQVQSYLGSGNPTFQEWLEDNPDVTDMNTAQAMYDAVYKKLFGGQILQGGGQPFVGPPTFDQYQADQMFGSSGIVVGDTPEFDADADGIPDYIDIDGGQGTGVPAYGTVDRPDVDAMFGEIETQPDVSIGLGDAITGGLDALGDNPYFRATASILGGASDIAGLTNRLLFDNKEYNEAMDQLEERSGADYKFATKTSGARSKGQRRVLDGVLGSEADRVTGNYFAFAGSPYSFTAKEGGEFEPHMMFDPKTGKGYKANVPADHERMAEMGYLHKDEMKQGGEVVELSQDMIAQLIAAGADIEIL